MARKLTLKQVKKRYPGAESVTRYRDRDVNGYHVEQKSGYIIIDQCGNVVGGASYYPM